MKTAKDYLDEANSVVQKISPAEGIERHNSGNLVVVDVRDSSEFPKNRYCTRRSKNSSGSNRVLRR